MRVVPADTGAAIETVRTLLLEYVASLGPHAALRRFPDELAGLPGRYAPPAGALFLSVDIQDQPVGCVAVGPLDQPGACELKRLFVRPGARGTGAGHALARVANAIAARAGYAEVLLDTMPHMAEAQALYRALGFAEVDRYAEASAPDLLFFRKALR